jgi:hypothetical protein
MKRIIDLENDEEVNEAHRVAARGAVIGAATVSRSPRVCHLIRPSLVTPPFCLILLAMCRYQLTDMASGERMASFWALAPTSTVPFFGT